MRSPSVIQLTEFDAAKLNRLSGDEIVVTPKFVLYWKSPAAFCQWTTSIFDVDGVDYCCAEQFTMAEKARLYGDKVTENAILATEDPAEHQKLGRQVRGFSAYR